MPMRNGDVFFPGSEDFPTTGPRVFKHIGEPVVDAPVEVEVTPESAPVEGAPVEVAPELAPEAPVETSPEPERVVEAPAEEAAPEAAVEETADVQPEVTEPAPEPEVHEVGTSDENAAVFTDEHVEYRP